MAAQAAGRATHSTRPWALLARSTLHTVGPKHHLPSGRLSSPRPRTHSIFVLRVFVCSCLRFFASSLIAHAQKPKGPPPPFGGSNPWPCVASSRVLSIRLPNGSLLVALAFDAFIQIAAQPGTPRLRRARAAPARAAHSGRTAGSPGGDGAMVLWVRRDNELRVNRVLFC